MPVRQNQNDILYIRTSENRFFAYCCAEGLDFETYFSCEGVILKGMTPFLTFPGDSFRNERTLRIPFFRDDRKSAEAFWGFL